MRWKYVTALIVGLLVLWGCAQPSTMTPASAPSPTAMEEMEQIVKVEAEGVILHYRAETLWSEGKFSTILQNREDFSSNLVEKFTDDVSKHGERGEYVANAYVEINEEGKSTVLRCDIEGAISSEFLHQVSVTLFIADFLYQLL